MKILITGGLGFIGKNLVSILCRYKKITKIIVIDKNIPDRKYLRDIHDYCYFSNKNKYKSNSKRINFIKCNTNNFNFALDITKNIDYVIHLAAESGVDISIKRPNDSFMTNVVGTFNYLEASRINSIKNFIFSSSGAVFGDANPPMKIKYHKQPISPYGSSKLTIETYCYTYSSIFKIPTTVLRFSNAYGEYSSNKKSIVAQIIKSYLNDSDISIYGDGTQSRDFIYVKDICSAIIKCLKKSSGYNEHHIGTAKETSINELLKNLNAIFSKHYIKKPNVRYVKKRKGDMLNNSLDISKTKKVLNWTPLYSLNDGLINTVKWYLDNKF